MENNLYQDLQKACSENAVLTKIDNSAYRITAKRLNAGSLMDLLTYLKTTYKNVAEFSLDKDSHDYPYILRVIDVNHK